jgi:hypothetical protein
MQMAASDGNLSILKQVMSYDLRPLDTEQEFGSHRSMLCYAAMLGRIECLIEHDANVNVVARNPAFLEAGCGS